MAPDSNYASILGSQIYADLAIAIGKGKQISHATRKFIYTVMGQVQPGAESGNELPLIAINIVSKETNQMDALERADALKTLADVCCEEVFDDVQRRCFDLINDQNPNVKKTALIGILKLNKKLPLVFQQNSQAQGFHEELTNFFIKGTKSVQIDVIATSLVVAEEVLPCQKDVLALIHPVFYKLVSNLKSVPHYICIYNLLAQYIEAFMATENSKEELQKVRLEVQNCLSTQGSLDNVRNLSLVGLLGQLVFLEQSLDLTIFRSLSIPLGLALSSPHQIEKLAALRILKVLLNEIDRSMSLECASQVTDVFLPKLRIRPNEASEVQILKVSLIRFLSEMNQNTQALGELIYIAKGASTSAVRISAVKSLANLTSDAFNLGQSQGTKDFIKLVVNTLTELLKHPDSAVVSEAVVGLQQLMAISNSESEEISEEVKQNSDLQQEVLQQCALKLQKLQDVQSVRPHHHTMLRFFIQHFQGHLLLAQETLRCLILSLFYKQDTSSLSKSKVESLSLLKCHVLDLSAKLSLELQDQESESKEKTKQIQKYLYKVASKDFCLIVRQKSRLVQNVIEEETLTLTPSICTAFGQGRGQEQKTELHNQLLVRQKQKLLEANRLTFQRMFALEQTVNITESEISEAQIERRKTLIDGPQGKIQVSQVSQSAPKQSMSSEDFVNTGVQSASAPKGTGSSNLRNKNYYTVTTKEEQAKQYEDFWSD